MSLALEEAVEQTGGGLKIAVLRLPRIANFDDLDPLRLEPGVALQFVQAGEPIPADARLVIIPGSKSTIADLVFLKIQGWDIDLRGPYAPRRARARHLRRLPDARPPCA